MHARTTIPRARTRGWKGLASLLVLLPTIAVLGAQAATPAAATSEICAGDKVEVQGETKTITYTAPEGYLVSSWCVKAGTTTDVHELDPPVRTITISHSSGKGISHYSVTLVKAPEEKPLAAKVTAAGTKAKTYPWTIEKDVDATTRTVDATGTATFTYTVTVAGGTPTESGWAASGKVTATNPNAYAVTADVAVATDMGGGSSCTVTGGDDATVPAGGATTLDYACSFSSAPAGSGTVTATVTWDPAGTATSATTTATAALAFALTSETNKTVAVVDDKTVPGQRIVLDPALTWSSGIVKTYTYSLAVPGGAAGACATHTNTATVDQPVGTDPSDTATVTACTPPVTPPPPPPPPVTPPVVPPVVPPVTPPVVTPPPVTPPVVTAPEVLPEQAFGKAVGRVKVSCQGTVRARLTNRSGERVVYTLRVGTKVHRITVKAQDRRKFVTRGPARAAVVLKVGSTRLDRVRIPGLCAAPEVLPDTGVRPTSS